MICTALCFLQPQRDRAACLSARMKRVVQRSGNEAMKYKDRIGERGCQDRLESLLKSALNTNLQPLRSLETATTKRRAQKKNATDSGLTKSTKTTSG